MSHDRAGRADHHGSLSDRMATAARDLEDQLDPATTYAMATDLAVANVDGCDAASLSMVRRRGREIRNYAATHPTAARADDLQTTLGEGPCLDTIATRRMTYSPSLAYDERWPLWGPETVEETGLHSVLSFQLFTHGNNIGALNMYAHARGGFSDEDQYDGLALAAHVAIAFAAAQNIEDLGKALTNRTVIGQATGILMERFQIPAERAFAVLARVSSRDEVKVQVTASRLVETRRLPGIGQDPPGAPAEEPGVSGRVKE